MYDSSTENLPEVILIFNIDSTIDDPVPIEEECLPDSCVVPPDLPCDRPIEWEVSVVPIFVICMV